jgi:hypothetical protein
MNRRMADLWSDSLKNLGPSGYSATNASASGALYRPGSNDFPRTGLAVLDFSSSSTIEHIVATIGGT